MKIDYLDILLGSSCNLKCKYCIQTSEENNLNHKVDSLEFSNKLLKWFFDNNLEYVPTRISYWGGEPLLYFDYLKNIHDNLFHRGIIPKFCSRISTNGTLVDDDYINWANSFTDIRTTVSLHSMENLSEKNIKKFGKLNNVIFTEVFSHKNNTFDGIMELFFEFKKITGRSIPIVPIFMKSSNEIDKSYFYDFDDVFKLIESLKRILEMNNEFSVILKEYIKRDFLRKFKLNKINNYCVSDDRLSIDLFGNRYNCHHNFSKENIIGNIFQKRDIIKIYNVDYFKFYNSERCKNCDIRLYCRGNCPISMTHEIDCFLSKELFKLVF